MAPSWRRALLIGTLAFLPSAALAADEQDGARVEFGFTPISLGVGVGNRADLVTLRATVGRATTFGQGAFVQWFASERLGIEPGLTVDAGWSDYNDGLSLALSGPADQPSVWAQATAGRSAITSRFVSRAGIPTPSMTGERSTAGAP